MYNTTTKSQKMQQNLLQKRGKVVT